MVFDDKDVTSIEGNATMALETTLPMRLSRSSLSDNSNLNDLSSLNLNVPGNAVQMSDSNVSKMDLAHISPFIRGFAQL